MMQRTARTRYRSPLLALSTGVALALGLSGCVFGEPPNPLDANIPAGDDTPFHERQSLEDYAATVPPAIVEFQERLTQAGSGEWRHSQTRHQFNVFPCKESDQEKGNDVGITSGDTDPIPPEKVTEIGNGIFIPLGYYMTSGQDDSGTSLTWIDWHNGGYFEVFVGPKKITISGNSECRPSRDPERVRLELRALVPLPSESPASPEPTPGHTRTLPRTAQLRTAQRCTAQHRTAQRRTERTSAKEPA